MNLWQYENQVSAETSEYVQDFHETSKSDSLLINWFTPWCNVNFITIFAVHVRNPMHNGLYQICIMKDRIKTEEA
jgi:hypothetical protein